MEIHASELVPKQRFTIGMTLRPLSISLCFSGPFFPGQLGPRQQQEACSVTSCARITTFGASKDQSQGCSQERREVALPPLLSTFLSSPIGLGQSTG